MKKILVVDDKDLMRESVCTTLERAGFSVCAACDGASAISAIAASRPDAVVSDMRMPNMTGIELLEKIREIDDDLPVILMTAFGAIDSAVKAMRLGAFDYLTKPFEGDELIIAVKRAIEHGAVRKENALYRAGCAMPPATQSTAQTSSEAQTAALFGTSRLIGSSDVMKQLRDEILAVADSSGTVLIHGESGSGKEVVARAVHESSPRAARGGPYLAVNCAALSESLLESELFGHERGAFTGAERLRKGRFELADHGTLLLDEISEISPSIQAKLLRVLQERAFERVGSSVTIGVDVRVIGTSNRDLPQTVKEGKFRQDLYFRLNVLPIRVPSLRERREDIPDLARYFIESVCKREGRLPLVLDHDGCEVMKQYTWPGNVRELANICERAVVLTSARNSGSSTGVISASLLASWLHGQSSPVTAPEMAQSAAPSPHVVNLHVGESTSNPAQHASATNAHIYAPTFISPSVQPPAVAPMSPPSPPSSPSSPTPITQQPTPIDSTLQDIYHNAAAVISHPWAHANAARPTSASMPESMTNESSSGNAGSLQDLERHAITQTLIRFDGHRQRTAQALGIGVRTLGLKIKKWKEQGLLASHI